MAEPVYKSYDSIPPGEFLRFMDAHCEALLRVHDDPGSLTDADIHNIQIVSPKSAREARDARDRATAPRTAPAQRPPSVRIAAIREDEELDDFFERCKFDVVPLYLFKHLYDFSLGQNEKNKERNARIATLEADNAELKAQIAELKARPGMKYQGVWHDGMVCDAGDVVTDRGSMWIAKGTTAGRPGEDHPVWQLCVKRGRDGRDGKEPR
jgi:hypothetical protein